MTILVTGANGMIGSQLVQGLLKAGYRVIGLDRKGESMSAENYKLIVVDLSDKEQLETLLQVV